MTKPAVLALAAVLALPAAARAQQTPDPVGTVALEGAMRSFYAAAHKLIVVTADGVEHTFRFTKNLIVHGGKGSGPDALADLREGTSVVVHYSGTGENQAAEEVDEVGGSGLKVTEGVVTRIDRRAKTIAVRFDDGTKQEFALTDRAAADAGRNVNEAGGGKILIYYSDDQGRRIAHYFKPAT